MKNTFYFQIFPLLLIMLTVGYCPSCVDEPETVCTPENTVNVPQELKDRFLFLPGTWWVYENIQNGAIDSFWVVSSRIETINVDDDDFGYIKNKCYDVFETVVQTKSNTNHFKYTSYSTAIYPKEGHNLNDELFGIDDNYALQPNIAFYRLEFEGNVYSNQMGATVELIDSIESDLNIIYKDILHIYYPTGTKTYDYLLNMYYARNIGLVKFHRRADNSHWELVRYHANQ